MGKHRGVSAAKYRGRLITRIMARDGDLCTACQGLLDRHVHDDRDAMYVTFDHILPLSKGGLTELRNLRLLHRRCNAQRGNDANIPRMAE
jgi:5-methylcytosine-specific restriction endonuclease McrA